MYNNPIMPNYGNNLNQQSLSERIDAQISQLQQMKEQMKNNHTQPAINQTFQLAPNGLSAIKYANTIDDVAKEMIFADTPFFSKDMSVVWIKTPKGIKTYELNEIIPKDDKDIQIEYLQSQIEELKGMIKNDAVYTNVNAEQDATDTAENDEPIGTTTKKIKSSSIQKISGSKEK